MTVVSVVIGRNEGARLVRCLEALQQEQCEIVYVDSASTDGSVAAARDLGAEVLELDMSRPFSAARARNEGIAVAAKFNPDYIQVIDGDCEIQKGWIAEGVAHLENHDDVAVVAGRLREKYPEATVWNRLADAEWDTKIGEVDAVGGIALLRVEMFNEIGGYDQDLIAGEEPEMCARMRQKGWKIWRLEAEMALHDIAMTRFSQWWKRMRRSGHAFAEGAHRFGHQGYRRAETRRAVLWAAAPLAILFLALLVSAWALVLFGVWPIQMLRLKRKGFSTERAFFLVLGRFPEAQGVIGYWVSQLRGRSQKLIEYK